MKSTTSRKVRKCAALIDHTVSDLIYYFDKTCPVKKLNDMMGVGEEEYLSALFENVANNAKCAMNALKEERK